jgi:hypothetical protein
MKQIRAALHWLAWAIFGNDDDGLTGPADFCPSLPAWLRATLWWLRNPFHNLAFYVIGVADRPFANSGRYPSDVFAPLAGWNWALRWYRHIPFPFFSYWRAGFKVYVGWRERGNFGVKFNLSA